jgi:hypothetical protein
MTNDELVRLEREAVELQARIRELRATPRNVSDLNRLSPREIAALDRDVLNAALAAGPEPLHDPYGPGGLTISHLKAMSVVEVQALRESDPDAIDRALAGERVVLKAS